MFTINLNYNIISHLTNYIYIEGIRKTARSWSCDQSIVTSETTALHLCAPMSGPLSTTRARSSPPASSPSRKKKLSHQLEGPGSGTELIIFFCHSNRRQTHHRLYINKHCYRIRIRFLDIVTVIIHVIQHALQGLRDAVQALARSEHTKIPFLSFFYWGEWRTKRIKIAQNG